MLYVIDHAISCSQNPAGKKKNGFFFSLCAAGVTSADHVIKFNLENITIQLAFLSRNTPQSPQRIYIDILMRMLTGFEI